MAARFFSNTGVSGDAGTAERQTPNAERRTAAYLTGYSSRLLFSSNSLMIVQRYTG